MYAPGFEFNKIEQAASYRFVAGSDVDHKEYVFTAPEPWAVLAPIWDALPAGYVTLKVEALNDEGEVVGLAGNTRFYRAQGFRGPYNHPVLDYRESARRALRYLFQQPHVQRWKHGPAPDESVYYLYCYPSKTVGALIDCMLLYAQSADSREAETAMRIAQHAADYLIGISEPAGTPLEYFPPTYIGEAEHNKPFIGQLFMIYPAEVAVAYLNLFDATKDRAYFEAASRIADTYVKLQSPDNTWPAKVETKTGKPIAENACMPMVMIHLFDRLAGQYGSTRYEPNSRSAFEWIMQNPVEDFHWEAQFEDSPLSRKYSNMAGGIVGSVAAYLLDHSKDNSDYVPLAEELLCFMEDQFVVWENPMPTTDAFYPHEQWVLPCALEQYNHYFPVDQSAGMVISAYRKAYEATGKRNYLDKAMSLANTVTIAQEEDGRYPTYWVDRVAQLCRSEDPGCQDWLNCATTVAKVMLDLGDMLAREAGEERAGA